MFNLLSINSLVISNVWLLGRKQRGKNFTGAGILICTSHYTSKMSTKFETLLHWGSHVAVRYKLSHPQAFEEEAIGGKSRNTSKCLPELPGKGETASGSVNSALCARPQLVDCPQHKGLSSLTFCYSFWNLPVGSRVLSMSLHSHPLTEKCWLCSDCKLVGGHLARRKHIVTLWTSLKIVKMF